MRSLLVCILPLLLLNCSKAKETSTMASAIKIAASDTATGFDYNGQYQLENYLVGEPADTSKIQLINFDCAVFVYPTHEQVEEMKKTEGEDSFYTLADDANFYQAQAIQLLDSAGIKTAGTQKQYVKFIGNDGSWTLDVRKKNAPAWNLILFKKNKAPRPSPAINVSYKSIRNFFE